MESSYKKEGRWRATVLVAIGVALPIYGATLDGRDQAERKRADVLDLSSRRPDRRPAA